MSNKKKELNAKKRKANEIRQKKRYLKDTGFQIETLKWVFLSFVLIIFGFIATKEIRWFNKAKC